MNCPKCGSKKSKNVDSRPAVRAGVHVRYRRYECMLCRNRFTTQEQCDQQAAQLGIAMAPDTSELTEMVKTLEFLQRKMQVMIDQAGSLDIKRKEAA